MKDYLLRFIALSGMVFAITQPVFAASVLYTYDSLNRLTQAAYPDGSVVAYTYDAAGNRLTQTIAQGAPVITSANSTIFTVGQAGSFTVTAAGTPPATFSATSLPSWASLNSTTGVLSGTPPNTTSAPFTINITAANGAAANGTQVFTLNVQPAAPTTLFADNFDENTIDLTKWTTTGNTVVDSGGIMQVETTVTDQPGILTTVPIAVNSTGIITITRSVILHRDVTSGHYFTGIFSVQIGSLPVFGIDYDDYDYSDSNLQVTHGFFMRRNGAAATQIAHQADVSPAITPIWDTWFNEKLTYDPISGQAEYFINGVSQMTFNVGVLPASTNPTMTLTFEAYGWFTGHYQDMDNLVVTQSAGASLMQFSQWQTAKFGVDATNPLIAGATATPQNDGVPNLLKYLYDINPSGPMGASDRGALPALGVDDTTTPGTEYLMLTYRENQLMTGITVHLQTSLDLQNWTPVNPPDIFQQVGTDSMTGDPMMEIGVKMNGSNKQFIRLNVTQP